MEKKETAIEWLNSNLIHIPYTQKDFAHNVKIIEKAKVMHKEQISRGYQEGLIDGMNHSPKDYYDETYGK
jgi:hypothetical protein